MKDRIVSHNFSPHSKFTNRSQESDIEAELEEDYPDHEPADLVE
jgi:hypothetical protein